MQNTEFRHHVWCFRWVRVSIDVVKYFYVCMADLDLILVELGYLIGAIAINLPRVNFSELDYRVKITPFHVLKSDIKRANSFVE